MLQNLANKPSYAKEAYMMSLNPFVDNNKTRMNLFLNSLCDVGDFYDTLEVRLLRRRVVSPPEPTPLPCRADGPVHGVVKKGPAD